MDCPFRRSTICSKLALVCTWVATNGGGVCRMDAAAVSVPAAAPARFAERPGLLFHCLSLGRESADRVNVLAEDQAGRIWIGTDGGLFRLDDSPNGRARPVAVDIRDAWGDARPVGVSALMAGEAGEMWIGTGRGVVRFLEGAQPLLYPGRPAAVEAPVRDIARGVDGHVWVAYPRGLLRVCAVLPSSRRGRQQAGDASSLSRETSHWIDVSEGEIGESALLVSADGHVWIGTTRGLLEFNGQRFRRYDATHGLPERLISELAEDHNGNLWIASLSGVIELRVEGFLTYDQHDGLTAARVHALFENATGHVYAVGGNWIVSRFDGVRFVSVQPRLPPAVPRWMAQLAFLDRSNAWWFLVETDLGRYPAGDRIEKIDGRFSATRLSRALCDWTQVRAAVRRRAGRRLVGRRRRDWPARTMESQDRAVRDLSRTWAGARPPIVRRHSVRIRAGDSGSASRTAI